MNMVAFRNNVRTCFDLAEQGKVVVIERNGVTFHIICPDTDPTGFINDAPEFASTTGQDADDIDERMEKYGARLDR